MNNVPTTEAQVGARKQFFPPLPQGPQGLQGPQSYGSTASTETSTMISSKISSKKRVAVRAVLCAILTESRRARYHGFGSTTLATTPLLQRLAAAPSETRSLRFRAVTEERPGIFGLETEHAILYVPDEVDEGISQAASRPPFDLIQRVLFDCLLSGRKAGVSSGIKDGYFLENGGLVHLEIFLRNPSDVPILEVATPECRSPWDLLIYSRAYDEILEETSRRSSALLELQGYRGRIAFDREELRILLLIIGNQA